MAKGKIILIVIVLLMFLMGLWSLVDCAPFSKCMWQKCNGKNCSVDADSAKKVTLKMVGSWDTQEDWKEIIDAFKAYEVQNRGLNVTIEYEKLDKYNYEEILLDRMLNKKSPDIFMIYNTWVPKYQQRIEPMPEGMVTLSQFKEAFPQVATDDLIVDDKIYSLPMYIDTLALFYNKDMFANAGIIKAPETWNEFVADVEKLTVFNESGGIDRLGATMGGAEDVDRSQDIAMLIVMQNNKKATLHNSQTLVSFDTAEARGAIKFYTDFANPASKFYTWDYNDKTYSIDLFTGLRSAMSINYSYEIENIQSKTGGSLNYAVAPVPQQYPNDKVNYVNYWSPVVSNNPSCIRQAGVTASCTDIAWDFIYFAAQSKNARSYIESTGRPAANLTLAEEQAGMDGSPLAPFATQILTAKSWANIDNEENDDILLEMIDSIITTDKKVKKTVSQAMTIAKNQIKELN